MGTELTEAVTSASEAQSQQGDGSNKKGGGMGAGYLNLRGGKKRQQRKVGREKERFILPSGTSSLCHGITRHP